MNPSKTVMSAEEAVLIAQAKLKVQAVERGYKPHVEVSILLWGETGFGPRVAEVGFTTKHKPDDLADGGMSGGVYMQCDAPHGIAVCAQAERYLIALMLGPDAEGWPPDNIEEEWERLTTLI